jgi:23S rRNA pseudouridine2605 synthase
MTGRSRPPSPQRHGLARALSKRGYCSRSAAAALIAAGRVRLDGRIERNPEAPTTADSRIEVDGAALAAARPIYLMLNKPRGLVTTTADEHARDTVYRCLRDTGLPWLAPVGRLDKASEGLLLMTNDTAWAAHVTDPAGGVEKTYHVQIDRVPDTRLIDALMAGVDLHDGGRLGVVDARILRAGARHGWLECVLDEGRNRHLRRLLAALDVAVLRLVRVAIGRLVLGGLAKGAWRLLEADEVGLLAGTRAQPARHTVTEKGEE